LETTLKNVNIFTDKGFVRGDVSFCGIFSDGVFETPDMFDNAFVFPGFTDVHVHLREPGFSYKETIRTGTMAAARGGYTTVCAMPNLNPVPDSLENLKVQTDLIARDAVIGVIPYGAITKGERGEKFADMDAISPYVVAFSDDGRGVQSDYMMEKAMEKAASLGKIIAAHCEDERYLNGICLSSGFAAKHGYKGITGESEWRQIERDVRLAEKTGCAYHVCHISARESIELIRDAKKSGVNITCETAPHYLLLDDEHILPYGRFKMNPPIRGKEDRQTLIEGLTDGTIDIIATDHAPHSSEEKSRPLEKCLNGVVGLETAFATVYTGLVKTGIITLEKLIGLLHTNPKNRFGAGATFSTGKNANFTVFNLDREYVIDPAEFLSMGKSSPFEGEKVCGRCLLTVYNGKIVWKDGSLKI